MKPSPIRRKWFKLIDLNSHLDLLHMLFKLKAVKSSSIDTLDNLLWKQYQDYTHDKWSRTTYDDDKPKYGPAPRSIKPTKARSRF